MFYYICNKRFYDTCISNNCYHYGMKQFKIHDEDKLLSAVEGNNMFSLWQLHKAQQYTCCKMKSVF